MTMILRTNHKTKLKHIKALKFLLERYIEPTPIFYKKKNIIIRFDNKRFDIDKLISDIDFILEILWLGDNQLNLIDLKKY